MNERIKELIEQADIKFDKDINEIDVCVLLPSDLEKFAELIIQDCMDQCDVLNDAYHEHRKNTSDFPTKNVYSEGAVSAIRCRNRIKSHFGLSTRLYGLNTMKVYQLTGVSVDGGEDWPCSPIYSVLEKAEKQKQVEIDAYTKVKGVVVFECPYEFSIEEKEVK